MLYWGYMIPQSLRTWFVIHFIADYAFAIPLFFFPEEFLSLFRWQYTDPIATILVSAALFAIGGISLLHRNADKKSFHTMLQLKLIWSGSVILGLLMLFNQQLGLLWYLVLFIFSFFFLIWLYYYRALLK